MPLPLSEHLGKKKIKTKTLFEITKGHLSIQMFLKIKHIFVKYYKKWSTQSQEQNTKNSSHGSIDNNVELVETSSHWRGEWGGRWGRGYKWLDGLIIFSIVHLGQSLPLCYSCFNIFNPSFQRRELLIEGRQARSTGHVKWIEEVRNLLYTAGYNLDIFSICPVLVDLSLNRVLLTSHVENTTGNSGADSHVRRKVLLIISLHITTLNWGVKVLLQCYFTLIVTPYMDLASCYYYVNREEHQQLLMSDNIYSIRCSW